MFNFVSVWMGSTHEHGLWRTHACQKQISRKSKCHKFVAYAGQLHLPPSSLIQPNPNDNTNTNPP